MTHETNKYNAHDLNIIIDSKFNLYFRYFLTNISKQCDVFDGDKRTSV